MSTSGAAGVFCPREPSALNRALVRFTARLHGYAPAVTTVAVASGITYFSDRIFGPGAVFLFFVWLIAILIGAWCGYGPGLLTVMIVGVVVPFLTQRDFSLSRVNPAGIGILAVVSLIVSQTAAARRRAEALLRQLNEELDRRVREKTAALEGANQELECRLAELETLYAKVPVGLCFLDRDLRFLRVNENLVALNARSASYVGRRLQDVASPPVLNLVEPLYRRVLETGEPLIQHELRIPAALAHDAKERWWSLSCSRVQSDDGAVLGLQVIVHDITERTLAERALEQANQELRQANRDLEQFAYSASHDLQEPLRMVAIYSQMLQKKFGGRLGPEADQYLSYTLGGARRMEHLVRDLLAYTQASSFEIAAGEAVDVNTCVQSAIGNPQAAIAEANAVIEVHPLPSVRMHGVHLEQLFLNLIGNAVKYRSEDPARIIVAAESRGQEWIFSVTDNGIGIAPEYRQQVFGLFKRLHTATEYSGTGIGLAICQRIVERYEGSIWIESAGEKGSKLLFLFRPPSL